MGGREAATRTTLVAVSVACVAILILILLWGRKRESALRASTGVGRLWARPGQETLVIFSDGVPSRSLVADYLEVASTPESLRFMCWTSSHWNDPVTDVRPRGLVTEKSVIAVSVGLDPVPGFDEVARGAIASEEGRDALFSHFVPKAMRFEKNRGSIPARLQRYIVPMAASIQARGLSFAVPDRRLLVFPGGLADILVPWCPSACCDVLLGEVLAREGVSLLPLPKCAFTAAVSPTAVSSKRLSAQELRAVLVTAALVTHRDSVYINVLAPDSVLALVHAR
jgi:hypothetical protein